jgi:DNA mismatch endonuclease (patch repair protein)
MAFPSRKAVINVNGCFWHAHQDGGCNRSKIPKTNREFWAAKLSRNVERDVANAMELRAKGWRQLVVWECQLKNVEAVEKTILKFLCEGTE